MLKYLDNYKYSSADSSTIDTQIDELKELIAKGGDAYDIYKSIRQYIYKQIKIEQLAITKILNDLIQIRQQSQPGFIVVMAFTANPLLSYKQLAQQFGVSKQRIYAIIAEQAKKYVWIDNLLKIKGLQDSKNENNRSIFFNKLDKNIAKKIGGDCFIEQMELF